ncbi:LPO_1073/Vpar_1526 family protein [Salmonirosea aquatica]|uniref:Uncharacterized protein n=1 Tax=Salmonirosea aquatica TaxID=2654236 RepID=A0A7C9BA37_9BACT|nr:hypothetical protein [Cytophagaceae bacterium SJW1-29]
MKQDSGDNSSNIQIAGNASFGISATEARQIAIDVFKANYYEFSEKAAKKALERAEEITDNFIKNFYEKIPHLEEKLQEPSVQSSMFIAQKEYARTGDQDLKDQLLDLLIQRIDSKERSLKQIVLDEAITIIPKLTQDQINILTLIFSAVYYNHRDIKDLNSFFNFLNIKILYFYPNNEPSYSFFTHLQFTGCCTLLSEGSTYKPFEQIIVNRYKALFIKGFTEQEYSIEFGEDSSILRPLLIRCIHNPVAFQFNAMNDEVFESQKVELNLGAIIEKAMAFQNKFLMSDSEIIELLISNNILFENFIKNWKETEIKTITPTSVGFAIAVLNYNRVTGENILVESFL